MTDLTEFYRLRDEARGHEREVARLRQEALREWVQQQGLVSGETVLVYGRGPKQGTFLSAHWRWGDEPEVQVAEHKGDGTPGRNIRQLPRRDWTR